MKLISKREFAKQTGLSANRVSEFVRNGVLKHSVSSDGKIDPEFAEREIDEKRDRLYQFDYEYCRKFKK
jgi:hypothetical protein